MFIAGSGSGFGDTVVVILLDVSYLILVSGLVQKELELLLSGPSHRAVTKPPPPRAAGCSLSCGKYA